MLLDVYGPIMEELTGVRERIKKYYGIKMGNIKDFAHLEKEVERLICPALVLLTAGIYGRLTEKIMPLAVVFQFIDQAVMVHKNINEGCQEADDNCTDPRDGCQYPVLVGDYLYGRFFTTLCEEDMLKYLKPLSEIICMMNEGGIIRLRNQNNGVINPVFRQEIVRLETAELLGGCCRLAGEEIGADLDQQQHLSDFGRTLGMAFGMAESQGYDQAIKYFKDTLLHLERLNPGKGREDLRELVLYLLKTVTEDKKMVG